MIKAIIFDLDGVIVNSEPVHQRLENQMYAELGLDLPHDFKQSLVGTSSLDAWRIIGENYRLDKSPEELLSQGRGRYLEVLKSGGVPLSEGALDLISLVKDKGFKILLASSASSRTITEVLKWHRLDDIFRIYIGGDQVSRSKPEPEIFLKAAKMGEVDTGECLVIEDAFNGIKAARRAGMYCIGYQNHFTGKQDLSMADVVVNNLHEITLELIHKIEKKILRKGEV
jgi:HAD superfamily hydrolase (TIGR01509 family)